MDGRAKLRELVWSACTEGGQVWRKMARRAIDRGGSSFLCEFVVVEPLECGPVSRPAMASAGAQCDAARWNFDVESSPTTMRNWARQKEKLPMVARGWGRRFGEKGEGQWFVLVIAKVGWRRRIRMPI